MSVAPSQGLPLVRGRLRATLMVDVNGTAAGVAVGDDRRLTMATSGSPVATTDVRELEGSFEVLRSARDTLMRMCRMVMAESGIQVVPSFMPDQCDGYGTAPDSDWTIRMGFGNCLSARVGGTYGELCSRWLEGPEAFHDWIGHMAVAAARSEVDGDAVRIDGVDGLSEPSRQVVNEAKVGLTACGYLVSSARIPSYMTTCSFVAWCDDVLVLVAVTDSDDVGERKALLAKDGRRFLETSGRDVRLTQAMVVRVDDGHLVTEDVDLRA